MLGITRYTTLGGIKIKKTATLSSSKVWLDQLVPSLDTQPGGVMMCNYEYPGRYHRWEIGFLNPPLELNSKDNKFTLVAHNERGQLLLQELLTGLLDCDFLQNLSITEQEVTGYIESATEFFTEEERSKQPTVFTLVRLIHQLFASPMDQHLGLYGAFGYDLIFQFERLQKQHKREPDQKDVVLYLPDQIFVRQKGDDTICLQYEFETSQGQTTNLPRTGKTFDYQGSRHKPSMDGDHETGEYAQQVLRAKEYFKRGDLFEVVPSRSFFNHYEGKPSTLFTSLQRVNPSPYLFFLNLGGEYLIGSSPEMFVRVNGRRVETCPISGTIARGSDALEDANQIRELLNSKKDESELTMCTDVDRNDKSRICEPGSVHVIGRRQVEVYSHLIHTVDHVEGTLRPEFDAFDAFLTHMWAVTVTGAPKLSAVRFIEQHERSSRRWYGGAVGYFTFDGNLNSGLILRTIRLQNTIAETRTGATLLFDSDPESEEQETLLKASAMRQALLDSHPTKVKHDTNTISLAVRCGTGKRVLLVDYEDSFVHTLANYLRQTGAEVTTVRHGFNPNFIDRSRFNLVMLSPGPGRPEDFRVRQTVTDCCQKAIPVAGVCLGFQGIVESFGGKLGVLDQPMHGKSSHIFVTQETNRLFQGLPKQFEVGRYHSLYALPEDFPSELKITAKSDDGVIMGLEHQELPVAAVQFHPESVMTLAGKTGHLIIENLMQRFARI